MTKKLVNITTPLKAYAKDDGECLSLNARSACFITVFNEDEQSGYCLYFSERDKNQIKSSQDLKKLITLAAHPRSSTKIVGNALLSEILKTAFDREKIKVQKVITRNFGFEVFFYPADGRLRVSVDQGPASKQIRVMVVDDSQTIRDLLTQVINSDPDLKVIATIANPLEVEKSIELHKPDVITLDIHMPEMDGVTLLKKFIPKYHIPTVMITSISMDEGPLVLSALESGAVDYIQKPSFKELSTASAAIIEKIKNAAQAKVMKQRAAVSKQCTSYGNKLDLSQLIAIGSSTGGTEALKQILIHLPDEIPPIAIVQHIPAVFSLAFANRMNTLCKFEVKEAEDGDLVVPNRVLIAPGGKQMKLVRKNGNLTAVVDDGPPVNRHKPSVDVLFHSIAELANQPTIGVILTGMGADGAKGLLALKKKGAATIAQSEQSCVVFGMPREAIKLGAADHIEDLENIAEKILCLSTD